MTAPGVHFGGTDAFLYALLGDIGLQKLKQLCEVRTFDRMTINEAAGVLEAYRESGDFFVVVKRGNEE